ncbi:hypothetical protein BDN67DRAFT_528342 [Paxillus ammoniavirescens]|nr:hypothetical protein BDN67DRAFT_528342 [Paxillus ammoniavirescens]
MVFSGLLSLVVVVPWLSGSLAMVVHPNIFAPTSLAVCQDGYAWMNNEEGNSPCLAVAYVIAACAGDTWTQPALPPGYSYDSPNGTTATPCYCSWSCYNLMMACTLCQGPAYTNEVKTWPSFAQDCPSGYTDSVFPSGYVLAGNGSIPYWAGTDPTAWTSELFNIAQANASASLNKPDYRPSIPSSPSSGSSTNIGAIVGGTVGGLTGLLILVVGGYIFYKRRQYRRLNTTPIATPMVFKSNPPGHARWPSDSSAMYSQAGTTSPPPISYMTSPQYGMSGVPTSSLSSFQAGSPPRTDITSYTTNTAVPRNRPIPMV